MNQTDSHDHAAIDWLNATDLIAAPSQDRSRKSLQKILSTAQILFVQNGYDETTITEISKKSGVSVGSIYHRFPDKQSILYAVLENYRRTRFAQVDEMTAESLWRDKGPEDVVAFHVEVIFSSTRSDTDFMRLIERQRIVDPEISRMQDRWNEQFCRVMAELYRRHKARIIRPDIDKTVRYLHYIIRSSALWSILPTSPGHAFLDIDNREYQEEAAIMAKAYLGLSAT